MRIACSVLIASLALLVSCGPPDRQSSEALIGHWLGNASYRDATVKFEFDIVQSGDSLVAFFGTGPGTHGRSAARGAKSRSTLSALPSALRKYATSIASPPS